MEMGGGNAITHTDGAKFTTSKHLLTYITSEGMRLGLGLGPVSPAKAWAHLVQTETIRRHQLIQISKETDVEEQSML